jgi:hypothetical protein
MLDGLFQAAFDDGVGIASEIRATCLHVRVHYFSSSFVGYVALQN